MFYNLENMYQYSLKLLVYIVRFQKRKMLTDNISQIIFYFAENNNLIV